MEQQHEQEFYNSKHFTAEDIDVRLLEGYYVDAVQAGYPGTKEQFLKQLANTISSEYAGTESEDDEPVYDPLAKITHLYGTEGNVLYPITTEEAIVDKDGVNLKNKLITNRIYALTEEEFKNLANPIEGAFYAVYEKSK